MYNSSSVLSSSQQLQDNKVFLSMLNHVLSVDGFYFSTTYDLTHTLQRLANTSPEFQEMSLLERVRISVCFMSVSCKLSVSVIQMMFKWCGVLSKLLGAVSEHAAPCKSHGLWAAGRSRDLFWSDVTLPGWQLEVLPKVYFKWILRDLK